MTESPTTPQSRRSRSAAATGDEDAPAVRTRRRPGALTLVALVLLLAGLAAAGWYGTAWAVAAFGGGGTAQTRDQALGDARQAAINLTTVNSADVAGTLSNWNSVVTGDLATQFSASRTQLEQQITANPGSTQVTIVNAALTALDAPAGTATALIFADVAATAQGQQPLAQRFALRMTVQRTDAGWKAATLESLAQKGSGR